MRQQHRIMAIITIISVWLVATSVLVYAANVFNKKLNATVNIVANANFSYYSNAAATQPITQVTIGNLSPGESIIFTIYVKNTGTGSEIISTGPDTLASSVGTLTLTFDGQSQRTLAPGEVSRVIGTLVADDDATAGTKNFTLSVDALPPSTAPPTTTPTTVSYSATIQPIFDQRCNSCHPTGGVNLSNCAGTIASVSRLPGMGSNYLTATQLQSLMDWIDQGAPNN